MKVTPCRGRYASRREANMVNDLLLSSRVPDCAVLKKEAEEFIEYIKEKRSNKRKKTVEVFFFYKNSLRNKSHHLYQRQ